MKSELFLCHIKYLHVLEHCLQTTFTKASTILYQATNHRAVFRDVTILVPSTWPTDPSYTAATTQVFSNSDIVFVPPPAPAPPQSNPGAGHLAGSSATPRRVDVASTKAFAGCGLPGIRITMATDLLTNRALTPTFGAPGRYSLSTSLPLLHTFLSAKCHFYVRQCRKMIFFIHLLNDIS